MGLQLLRGELAQALTSASAQRQQELQGRLDEMASLEQDISSNTNVAVEILNELLSYDKVETGSMRLELSVISIVELISQTALEFRQPAKLKNIDFEVDVGRLSSLLNPEHKLDAMERGTDISVEASPNCQVVGDVARLSQVIRNLISNALKFTPEGGKLSIRAVRDNTETTQRKRCEMTLHSGAKGTFVRNGTLHLQVTDTGTGMTPAQLKSVFKEGIQFDVNLVSPAITPKPQYLLLLESHLIRHLLLPSSCVV